MNLMQENKDKPNAGLAHAEAAVEEQAMEEAAASQAATAEAGVPQTDKAANANVEKVMAGLRQELELQLHQMVEEAVRLSQMSESERAAYTARRREDDLTAREKRLAARELRADALDLLAQRGLPRELADAVGYESREAMLASIDNVERVFRQAVQMGVEERMRGILPVTGAPIQGGDAAQMDDEAYYRMNYSAR